MGLIINGCYSARVDQCKHCRIKTFSLRNRARLKQEWFLASHNT